MGWGEPGDHGDRPPTRGPAADTAGRARAPHTGAFAGIWALVGFTALSLWARTGFLYFPPVPPEWRAWLGRPPPLVWIHPFLVLYLFSALILSLTRMSGGWHPFTGFRHLGYLAAFYGFYAVSGGLEDNVWAVFVGGLSVLGLEGYRHWSQCRQQNGEEEEGQG